MSFKVAFISLGCAKNLVNTEQMMALCRDAGFAVTGEPEGADVAVLNTCGFIDAAKSEAIQNILELGQLKEQGKLKKLLVAGCLSQRKCHNKACNYTRHYSGQFNLKKRLKRRAAKVKRRLGQALVHFLEFRQNEEYYVR